MSKKLLFFGESPVNQTGAARVSKHLLRAILAAGLEVSEMLAVNHFCGEEYDHEAFPFPITNFYHETRLGTYSLVKEAIEERRGSFDYLFLNDDMHLPQMFSGVMSLVPTIALGAIDGQVRYKEQVDSFLLAALPAVYSKFAYNEVVNVLPSLSDKLRVIPLGCEPETFYPLPENERRAYRQKAFGIDLDTTFLVMVAARNQMRKDIGRAMKAFDIFAQDVPNSKLFVLSQRIDVGGDLVAQAKLLGCDLSRFIFTGDDYNALSGYDRDKLNSMYNSADVLISCAQGEGWGLTTSEAMAAGLPVIGPRNTTFIEMLGEYEERGYLAECGGDELWSIYYGQDNSPRPLTSVRSLVWKLHDVYAFRSQSRFKADQARAWSLTHTWDDFVKGWVDALCAL